MEYLSTGNAIVDEVSKINFQGDIMPRIWRKTITKENGKPYALARDILSDIVYWYRATEVVDENTLEVSMKKKFKDDLLFKSYEQFCEEFGESKRVIRDALKRLEEIGVIKRQFRTVHYGNGTVLNNVMYIELIPSILWKLTYPETLVDGKTEVECPKDKKEISNVRKTTDTLTGIDDTKYEETTENREMLPPSDENVNRVVTKRSRHNQEITSKNTEGYPTNPIYPTRQIKKFTKGEVRQEQIDVIGEFMQDISALKRTPTNTEMDFHEVRAEEKRLREKLLTVIENNFATNTGETYPMDFVKSWFDYQSVQLMKANYSLRQEDVDLVFVILHDILNSTKERLRICGEEKPTAVVISRLFKLTPEDLLYALKQYHRQTTKIRNHRAYLLTVLYLAKEQNELDISNRVMHNMYGNKEG